MKDFTEPGAFSVKDRDGYPLGRLVRASGVPLEAPARPGDEVPLVKAIRFDKKGALVEIREWYGRFTGRQCVARPEHCLVERGPKEMRNQEASRARRQAAQPAPPAGAARAVRRKPLA